ncbi:deoxynucleoside kinase [Nostoc sp. FACHB-145]|uniref:deoxynucleoside kinase n=1 Tax=Nostoc sp. FACHB-145 TaxID=2692836 RepID=UPI0016881691|nr:deoxynucleoside kinase [Nostoc sp. FACHB-145]MBD2470945.1 deoxynucleoside kinase [Nostoc sp. FACHB-145]
MYPFLALEGCDGAGKTTIVRLISQALKQYNLPVFAVGQHSWLHLESSRVIAKVRAGVANFSADIISQAYRLDKKQHYKFNIAPAQSQAIVISDRWILSDAVYQEVLNGMRAEDTLATYMREQVPYPSMILYVTCDVSGAYSRILSRGKASRHYERPAELSQVCITYERIFQKGILPNYVKLLRIENQKKMDDLNIILDEYVVPNILDLVRCYNES